MASAKKITELARRYIPNVISVTVGAVNLNPRKRAITIGFIDNSAVLFIDRYDDNRIVLSTVSGNIAEAFISELAGIEDLTRVRTTPVKRASINKLVCTIVEGI